MSDPRIAELIAALDDTMGLHGRLARALAAVRNIEWVEAVTDAKREELVCDIQRRIGHAVALDYDHITIPVFALERIATALEARSRECDELRAKLAERDDRFSVALKMLGSMAAELNRIGEEKP